MSPMASAGSDLPSEVGSLPSSENGGDSQTKGPLVSAENDTKSEPPTQSIPAKIDFSPLFQGKKISKVPPQSTAGPTSNKGGRISRDSSPKGSGAKIGKVVVTAGSNPSAARRGGRVPRSKSPRGRDSVQKAVSATSSSGVPKEDGKDGSRPKAIGKMARSTSPRANGVNSQKAATSPGKARKSNPASGRSASAGSVVNSPKKNSAPKSGSASAVSSSDGSSQKAATSPVKARKTNLASGGSASTDPVVKSSKKNTAPKSAPSAVPSNGNASSSRVGSSVKKSSTAAASAAKVAQKKGVVGRNTGGGNSGAKKNGVKEATTENSPKKSLSANSKTSPGKPSAGTAGSKLAGKNSDSSRTSSAVKKTTTKSASIKTTVKKQQPATPSSRESSASRSSSKAASPRALKKKAPNAGEDSKYEREVPATSGAKSPAESEGSFSKDEERKRDGAALSAPPMSKAAAEAEPGDLTGATSLSEQPAVDKNSDNATIDGKNVRVDDASTIQEPLSTIPASPPSSEAELTAPAPLQSTAYDLPQPNTSTEPHVTEPHSNSENPITETSLAQRSNSENGIAETFSAQRSNSENPITETSSPQRSNSENGIAETSSAQRSNSENGIAETSSPQRSNSENGIAETSSAQRSNSENGIAETSSAQRSNSENGIAETSSPQRSNSENGIAETSSAEPTAGEQKSASQEVDNDKVAASLPEANSTEERPEKEGGAVDDAPKRMMVVGSKKSSISIDDMHDNEDYGGSEDTEEGSSQLGKVAGVDGSNGGGCSAGGGVFSLDEIGGGGAEGGAESSDAATNAWEGRGSGAGLPPLSHEGVGREGGTAQPEARGGDDETEEEAAARLASEEEARRVKEAEEEEERMLAMVIAASMGEEKAREQELDMLQERKAVYLSSTLSSLEAQAQPRHRLAPYMPAATALQHDPAAAAAASQLEITPMILCIAHDGNCVPRSVLVATGRPADNLAVDKLRRTVLEVMEADKKRYIGLILEGPEGSLRSDDDDRQKRATKPKTVVVNRTRSNSGKNNSNSSDTPWFVVNRTRSSSDGKSTSSRSNTNSGDNPWFNEIDDEEDDGLSPSEQKIFAAHISRMAIPGCFFEEPQFQVLSDLFLLPFVVDVLVVKSGLTERRTFEPKPKDSIGGNGGVVGGAAAHAAFYSESLFWSSSPSLTPSPLELSAPPPAGGGGGAGQGTGARGSGGASSSWLSSSAPLLKDGSALTLLLMVATANASHCEPVVLAPKGYANHTVGGVFPGQEKKDPQPPASSGAPPPPPTPPPPATVLASSSTSASAGSFGGAGPPPNPPQPSRSTTFADPPLPPPASSSSSSSPPPPPSSSSSTSLQTRKSRLMIRGSTGNARLSSSIATALSGLPDSVSLHIRSSLVRVNGCVEEADDVLAEGEKQFHASTGSTSTGSGVPGGASKFTATFARKTFDISLDSSLAKYEEAAKELKRLKALGPDLFTEGSKLSMLLDELAAQVIVVQQARENNGTAV